MGSEPVRVGYTLLSPGARAPHRATRGASGFDLRARVDAPVSIAPREVALVPTGLALAIPEGYEGQVRARSGLALKHGIFVLNGPGTIDSDYRGPLGVILANFGETAFTVADGERIAQIVFTQVPNVDLVALESLPTTERGEGGFGHTGIE